MAVGLTLGELGRQAEAGDEQQRDHSGRPRDLGEHDADRQGERGQAVGDVALSVGGRGDLGGGYQQQRWRDDPGQREPGRCGCRILIRAGGETFEACEAESEVGATQDVFRWFWLRVWSSG